MGIIGYGDIGRACGNLAKAFQMSVIALRRRPEMVATEKEEGTLDRLDRVFGHDSMLKLVAASDYIVMATPFTDATHKMFNAEAIAAMQPHAVFINIGRGKCVDEEALIEALEAGAH
jgi:phosphoglycerate dehydrogenase-like enzyme